MKNLGILAVFCCLMLVSSTALRAEDVFALTTSNKLVRFDSASPGTIINTVQITGLQASEDIVGIDFRPATGQLFAIGNSSRVYVIDVTTGAAVARNTNPFTPALTGTHFGVDFNPTVDRIRVSSDTAQNQRLNPNDGSVSGTDTALAYAAFDVSAGATPGIAAAAYTNNNQNATSTTLYAIDSTANTLVTIGSLNSTVSPNGGKLFTVGSLGFDISDFAGLDISGQTGNVYASLTGAGLTASGLYTINLSTGAASLIGTVGAGEIIVDIAVPTPPNAFDLVVLRSGTPSTLVRLDSRVPQIVSSAITITGLTAGETIQSIAFRPANGLMYGISSANRIYDINPIIGSASVIGTAALVPLPTDTNFSINFNPVPDRMRVVNSADESFRVNADTGIVPGGPPAFDGTLAYAVGDPNSGANPNIVSVGYTNHVSGAATTTLFGIDADLDILVTINPPNNGTLNTVGALGIDVTGPVGFDITPENTAFVAASVGGSPNLYTIDLATGAATLIGSIGTTNIRSLAAVNSASTPVLQFSAPNFSTIEGSPAIVTVTRTGGLSGTVSIDYAVTSDTGVAGANFVAATGTLTFVSGESSRNISVATLDDKTQALILTARVTLSNPVGASLGAQSTTLVNIADVNDHDSDGFTAAEEAAAGTSDEIAAETPFGGAPAGPVDTTHMTLSKVSVKLVFNKANSDSLSISGTISGLADGLVFTDKNFVINFGGFARSVKLTSKGSGATSDKTYSVKMSAPKGGIAKFSVKVAKTSIAAALADEGLANDPDSPTKAPRTVIAGVLFDGKSYRVTQNLLVSTKAGVGSSAASVKP